MADKYITQVDEVNSLVNMETGEAKTHYQHLRVQSFADFFIACFAAWNDFKMSEGTMVKVFIHCIMSSTMSRGMGVEEEGNYFYVSDVYESIKRNNDLVGGGLEMKDVNVRQYIKKLADGGFIMACTTKDADGVEKKIRGKYLINPKYGIKGRITEDTYTELVLRRFPKGRILPNKDFDKEGGGDVE
jgi:hypothetical protein